MGGALVGRRVDRLGETALRGGAGSNNPFVQTVAPALHDVRSGTVCTWRGIVRAVELMVYVLSWCGAVYPPTRTRARVAPHTCECRAADGLNAARWDWDWVWVWMVLCPAQTVVVMVVVVVVVVVCVCVCV